MANPDLFTSISEEQGIKCPGCCGPVEQQRMGRQRIYCSTSCGHKARRAANLEAVRAADRARRPPKRDLIGACPTCGGLVERRVTGKPRIYCSKQCRPSETPEKAAERWRKYAKENPGKCRAATKKWRDANSDHTRSYRKIYYEENREKILADNKAWTAANMESRRENWRAKRAKRSEAEGSHAAGDIRRILNDQRCKCAYCRASLKAGYHVDHLIALATGGTKWPSNLQLLCRPCNQAKSAKDPIEFAQSLGKLL